MRGSLHKVSGAYWRVDARAKQTRAVSDYALPQFVIAQPCKRMGCATDLEGADFLQVLALEEQVDLGAVFAGRKCGECFGSEDGGSVDAGLYELECLDDGGTGEGEGGRGHCRSGRVYRFSLGGGAVLTCTQPRVPPHPSAGYSTPCPGILYVPVVITYNLPKYHSSVPYQIIFTPQNSVNKKIGTTNFDRAGDSQGILCSRIYINTILKGEKYLENLGS